MVTTLKKKRPFIDDSGAEALQLAFALPLLMLAFGVAAQVIIWGFSSAQFLSAAESASYEINVSEIVGAGENSDEAKHIVATEIANRMIGVSSSEVQVDDIKVEELVTAKTEPTNTTSNESSTIISSYTTENTTCLFTFSACYQCPSIIAVGDPLTLSHTWTKDRLVNRRSEVE